MESLDVIPRELTEEILRQISWQYGILPTGQVGQQKCFVLKAIPTIRLLVDKDKRPPTLLVTRSDWTYNLIHSDALWNLYDDATLQALAECAMIFHRPEKPHQETFHSIHYNTYAYLRVNDIHHPTEALQKAIDDTLKYWPDHPLLAGRQLRKLWEEFGFLWPQRLKLGHKYHVKQTYDITRSGEDRLNELRQAQANDEASAQMEEIKAQKLFHQEGQWRPNLPQAEEGFQKFVRSWTIVNRSDLRPIHEFFSKEVRDTIIKIFDLVVHRVPVHRPIRLLSLSTHGYLSWRTQSPSAKSKDQQQRGPATLFNTCGINNIQSTNSQTLWQMEWSPPCSPAATCPTPLETKYEPEYVRCGSRVYLYPVGSPSTAIPATMAITRAPVPQKASQQDQGKIRSLELLDPGTRSREDHQWVIEMENLGLEHDDDLATDMGRNVDVAIGRRRPIVHRDIISLRQVHYLCSIAPSGSPPDPNWPSPPPLPALLLSSPMTNSSTSIASNMPSILSSPQTINSTINSSATNSATAAGQKALNPVLVKEFGTIPDNREHRWVVEVVFPPSQAPSSKKETRSPVPPFPTDVLHKEAPLTSLGRSLKQVSNSLERLAEQQSSSQAPQETPDEDWDVCASANAEPYIRLYASKQRTKTLSHLVKAGSLSSLSKHFSH